MELKFNCNTLQCICVRWARSTDWIRCTRTANHTFMLLWKSIYNFDISTKCSMHRPFRSSTRQYSLPLYYLSNIHFGMENPSKFIQFLIWTIVRFTFVFCQKKKPHLAIFIYHKWSFWLLFAIVVMYFVFRCTRFSTTNYKCHMISSTLTLWLHKRNATNLNILYCSD